MHNSMHHVVSVVLLTTGDNCISAVFRFVFNKLMLMSTHFILA